MIVDASVAFKWLTIEDGSDEAAALIGSGTLRAPTLLLIEVGNALWKKAARGEIADQPAFPAQLALVNSLVEIVDEAAVTPRALEIALAIDHPIYDCIYLALAERDGDQVVTADARFLGKLAETRFAPLARELG